ncbi:MAG: ABC transporter substrate-binding protein [Thermoanaerobaculia bacterium]
MEEGRPSGGSSSVNGRKIVRVGILAPIEKLDPRDAVDNVSNLILGQIFEPAYAVPVGGTTIEPVLFSEPLRHDGGQRYSAAVRGGVVFSDGTPLTAEIVAQSLSRSAVLATKAVIAARGDRVSFTLTSVNPRFELTLTQSNCAIVLERDGMLYGTGPFMFEGKPTLRTLQATSPLRIVRNPLWRGSAKIDEAQFFVRLADADGSPRELIESLRRGEIDLTAALTTADMARGNLTSAVPALQPGNSTAILFFNTKHRSLSRADVRKAITLAIDVQDIAQRSYDKNPVAFIARSLLPPMMGKPTGLPRMSREEAKRLLSAAGADRPSRVSLLVPWAPRQYLPKPMAVAQAILTHLAEIGIAVDLRETTSGEEFFTDLTRGNFDLALAGWIADNPDPADFFEALLWSKTGDDKHANPSRWKHPATDAALAAFREAPTEENRQKLEELVREEAPLMPLIYGQSVVSHSRKVRGVSVSSTGIVPLAALSLM